MARRLGLQAFLGWFRSGEGADFAAPQEMAFALASSPTEVSQIVDAGVAFDEAEAVFADGELLEFLEADVDPVPADPEFRARLREQLWDMVQDGVTTLPKDH